MRGTLRNFRGPWTMQHGQRIGGNWQRIGGNWQRIGGNWQRTTDHDGPGAG